MFRTLRRKNPHKKDFGNQTRMNTIYGDESWGEQTKRFHLVHYVFKYKIVVPFLLILKRWLDKKLYQSPKGKVQFEHVELFEKAFDEATISWLTDYIATLRDKNITRADAVNHIKNNKNNTLFLNTIKKSASVLFMNDDAYLEWLVRFIEKMNTHSQEFYKAKAVDGEVQHLMHIAPGQLSKFYEHLYLQLRKEKNYGVFPIAKR